MQSRAIHFSATPPESDAAHKNRPTDSAFHQQRMKSYKITCSKFGYVTLFLLLGLLLIPLGVYFQKLGDKTYELLVQYDGSSIEESSSCVITESNAGSSCQISFTFDEDISGPIYIYYEIDEFYQNHRTYTKSRSTEQLMGENLGYSDVSSNCYPLIRNGSTLLNPCGLIANTFFNDVITFNSTDTTIEMDTDGITFTSDRDVKYKQVDGFKYAAVTNTSLSCMEVLGVDSCELYEDTSANEIYYYYYPDNDSVQYLYETFSGVISPIKGVTDEHFINWMTTAGLPKFRKLYGKIDDDVTSGTVWTFSLTLNFEVRSYGASKSLILTNVANDALGGTKKSMYAISYVYLAAGVWSLCIGFLLAFYIVSKATY